MCLFLKPSYLYVRWIYYCSYTLTGGLNTSIVGLNTSTDGLNTSLFLMLLQNTSTHNALPRLPLPPPTGRSSLALNCPCPADSFLLSLISLSFLIFFFLLLFLSPSQRLPLSSSLLPSLHPAFCLFMAFALSVNKFSIRY